MATTRNTTSETDTLGSTMDKNVVRASTAAHATLDKVSTAADKMSGTVRPALDDVINNAHGIVDNLAESANKAVEVVGYKGAQLKSMQTQWAESVRTYVRAKPLTALGIAAGVALVARRLLGR